MNETLCVDFLSGIFLYEIKFLRTSESFLNFPGNKRTLFCKRPLSQKSYRFIFNGRLTFEFY